MKVLGILAASVLIAGSLSACSTQTAPSDEFKGVRRKTRKPTFDTKTFDVGNRERLRENREEKACEKNESR